MNKNKYQFIWSDSYPKKENLNLSLNKIIKDGWGNFGVEYVDKNIITADYLLLALHNNNIIGFTAARKINFRKKIVYYVEFTSVILEHQGKKLSLLLNKKLFIKLLLNNILSGVFSLEIMTISPNPRVLGSIYRNASTCYPDPYKVEPKPPEYITELTKKLLTFLKEPFKELDNYNVITGFYDNYPHLIHTKETVQKDKDKIINDFSNKLLKFDQNGGRDFVIYAKFYVKDFIKRIG